MGTFIPNFIPDWMADIIARDFDRTFPEQIPNTFLRVPVPRAGAIDARGAEGVPVITTAPVAARTSGLERGPRS